MAEVEKLLADLETLSDKLREEIREGNMLLVDLAGSTPFKTRHPEPAWLMRLHVFYATVESALAPHAPTKYLGDGIFAFFEDERINATDLLECARNILHDIEQLNKSSSFPGDYAITVRIILRAPRKMTRLA